MTEHSSTVPTTTTRPHTHDQESPTMQAVVQDRYGTAEVLVDHRRGDPLDDAGRYDVVIDAGGNRTLRALRRALTPTGTLVIVGGEGGGRWLGGLDRQVRAKVLSGFTRQRLTTFAASEDSSHLERLADLVERGQLRPVVDKRFPLSRAADAVARLEAGAARAKVVIEVPGSTW